MTKIAYFDLDEAAALFNLPAAPTPAISEYENERLSLLRNFHRLRAERLARESTSTPTAP
jgi:hypothetical protein